MWYVLELFRQCGMFWNCSESVVCFGTVPTVWYVLLLTLFQMLKRILRVLPSSSEINSTINLETKQVTKHVVLQLTLWEKEPLI